MGLVWINVSTRSALNVSMQKSRLRLQEHNFLALKRNFQRRGKNLVAAIRINVDSLYKTLEIDKFPV
jgi:hypothetical protein